MEYFFVSDASAIVEHTRKVIVLEDHDVVHIHDNTYQIFDGRQNMKTSISRIMQTLDIEVSQIMKGGYDHFMQKEIHEQPETVL